MMVALCRDINIRTPRLLLRPTEAADAQRGFEILSDWEVAKMLRMVTYPIDRQANAVWFAAHESEWDAGTAYRFAVILNDRMIGLIDIDEIADGCGSLGYWFESASWGNGYAKEAALAVKQFAFEGLRLKKLVSGHAVENEASGKILEALGFQRVATRMIPSLSRNADMQQHRYELVR